MNELTTLIQDSFNRPDNTTGLGVADNGQTWEILAGQWQIKSNQAFLQSSTNSIAVIESGESNVQIEVDRIAKSNNNDGGIILRLQDSLNYLAFYYKSWDGSAQFFKTVNGQQTTLAGNQYITPTLETPYRLKVIANGNTVQCYIDDVLQFTLTDTPFQNATKHGLRRYENNSEAFDNFLVQTLAPTGIDGSFGIGLTQKIYKDSSSLISLNQNVYKDSAHSISLDQKIYKDSSYFIDLSQNIYKDLSYLIGLNQRIYRDSLFNIELTETFYRETGMSIRLIQQIFKEGEVNLPLLIGIKNDLVKLIGSIKLKGERTLNLLLKGQRISNVMLKGCISVTVENQNFILTAGDSLTPIFVCTELKYNSTTKMIEEKSIDLSSSTVKWVLKNNVDQPNNLIYKTLDSGIEVQEDKVFLNLASEDTKELTGRYYHECEVTDALGNKSTLLRGVVVIKKSGV